MHITEASYEVTRPRIVEEEKPISVEDGVNAYVKIGNDAVSKDSGLSKLHKDKGTKFIAQKKQKYWAIYNFEWGQISSIHAFIDVETGELLKPAGYKAPAKGSRGNVTDPAFMKKLPSFFDIHGGHLYAKRH